MARALGSAQKRQFMSPPISQGLKMLFSQSFRGRAIKKRDQLLPAMGETFATNKVANNISPLGRRLFSTRRTPDIDDPRPPIIGWKTQIMDSDGSLPILPYDNKESAGRKVIQGLYKDFKELYNQHKKYIPLYGGGPWDPRETKGSRAFVCQSATVAGSISLENGCFIYPSTIIRGDLNKVYIRAWSVIMEGCVITTDGHPRNVHLPGRVSRLNEGEVFVGKYSLIHPNCMIDSAYIADYCEIGESCKLGYNSIMELGSSLEPGTVLLAHQRVPRFEIWGGNPGRKVGYREKNLLPFYGYVEAVILNQAKGLVNELPIDANYVAATRSSERMENTFDRLIMKNAGNLPEKVQEYIDKGTREIPLWEEFKNLSRVNTRPGAKRGHDWTIDPNKARWMDHY
ncbi:hypothetical protein DIPPA_35379 [Diplonema papillatum]|nr:hypothetical protein DIPPA_35379 [Diplonema papillatum]